MARLVAGDERAFSELFGRLHLRLVRVARRIVASDAEAEDVAQDTWQSVCRAIASFEGRSRLDTWILQLAIHRARTLARRGARVVHLATPEEGDDPLAGRFSRIGAWSAPLAPWPGEDDPERLLSSAQLAQLARAALDALPERERLVVVLRDLEGHDGPETCELLGLTPGHQRVLLHRGRLRIRAALERALLTDDGHVTPTSVRGLQRRT